MQFIADQQLLLWNRQGMIPGPNETEELFLQRTKVNLTQDWTTELPFKPLQCASRTILNSSLSTIFFRYNIKPDWLPVVFNNYRLAPWQGAATWIIANADGPQTAVVQLRKHFETSETYLKIYERDEILTHEFVHGGRIAFEEPRFEEILAYRLSPARFRRVCGPMIQSQWEAVALLAALMIGAILLLFFPTISLVSYLLAAFGITALIIRTGIRHWRFNRCLQSLEKTLGDPHNAEAVIYRLSDQEIIDFGGWSAAQIRNYCEDERAKSLRWRVIALAYFAL